MLIHFESGLSILDTPQFGDFKTKLLFLYGRPCPYSIIGNFKENLKEKINFYSNFGFLSEIA